MLAARRALLSPLVQRAQALVHLRALATTAAEEYDLIAPSSDVVTIQGYTAGGFTVDGEEVAGGICVAGGLLLRWGARRWADVTPASLAVLRLLRPPDILVLGCGQYSQPVGPPLRKALEELGTAIEASDTPNALATYNLLSQEGRAVAAAFLPVEEEGPHQESDPG